MTNIAIYYSTNWNTIQIWSWCSRYLSPVGNRYPAIYVASYVLNVTTVPFKIKFTRPFLLQGFRVFCYRLILLNNKTITGILLNLMEYRLILVSDLVSIRRYSARFRRIIVKYRLYLTRFYLEWYIEQYISRAIVLFLSETLCRFARYRFLPAIYRFHFAIYRSSFAIYRLCFVIYIVSALR